MRPDRRLWGAVFWLASARAGCWRSCDKWSIARVQELAAVSTRLLQNYEYQGCMWSYISDLIYLFFARPSNLAVVCILLDLRDGEQWRDGLHLWSKCQVKFDAALTDFNSRQFKTRMKIMAAHVDFCLFLNASLSCLQFGTWKLALLC